MTRDDLKWWAGIIGGAVVGVAGNLALFPWIPEPWQRGIGIAAFVYGIVSGKMATSPLPGKSDAQ